MEMTNNFKKYKKILSMNIYIYRKISYFLKLSMAYNVGVANFVRMWFST